MILVPVVDIVDEVGIISVTAATIFSSNLLLLLIGSLSPGVESNRVFLGWWKMDGDAPEILHAGA
jgi:hypothetical protein